MKHCNSCNQVKPFSEFNRKGTSLQSKCRSCQKLGYKTYYENNDKERSRLYARNKVSREAMRQYIRKAKDKPCTDCDVKYPYYVMQFDHIASDKEYTIATLVNYTNYEMVDKEIAKCEVVCANCHAIRTWKRSNS